MENTSEKLSAEQQAAAAAPAPETQSESTDQAIAKEATETTQATEMAADEKSLDESSEAAQKGNEDDAAPHADIANSETDSVETKKEHTLYSEHLDSPAGESEDDGN